MRSSTKQLFFSLFCSAAMASAAPILRLSTAAVGPLQIAPGTNAATQTVEAYSAGGGTLNLAVGSTASWIQPTAGAAQTCKASYPGNTGNCIPISIALNTASLAAGTYTEFVNLNDPAAIDSPQTISVTVVIGAVPSTLEFYTAPGGQASTTFDTRTPVTTQVSTASGGDWLAVALNAEGSFGFYVPYLVKITSPAAQAPGDYSGSVVVTGSNVASDNKTIGVTLHVTTSPIAVLNYSSLSIVTGQGSQTIRTITVANGGQGSLAVSGATATVTSGTGWLSAAVASTSAVTVTANASALAPGYYQGSITVAANAANSAQLTVPVNLLVTTSTGPQINFGGVVDNAVAQGTVSQGDIIAIYGSQFTAGSTTVASTIPLPTSLDNTTVTVNGVAAPLFYTSTGQLDAQVPYETAPGLATVQVTSNGKAGNQASVNVVARAPRILQFGDGVPIIVNTDGTIPVAVTTALPSHPAKRGDTLVIYAIGLGQTDPAAQTGVGAPSAEPLARVGSPVSVTVGGGFLSTGVNVTPLYVGLTPFFVGLYQINLTLPQNAPTGTSVPLSISVQGSGTQPVNIAIQ